MHHAALRGSMNVQSLSMYRSMQTHADRHRKLTGTSEKENSGMKVVAFDLHTLDPFNFNICLQLLKSM